MLDGVVEGLLEDDIVGTKFNEILGSKDGSLLGALNGGEDKVKLGVIANEFDGSNDGVVELKAEGGQREGICDGFAEGEAEGLK